MSELGKPILKKSDEKKTKKKTENQCQNAARENKKPLVRYVILILTKTRSKMSSEWIGKTI